VRLERETLLLLPSEVPDVERRGAVEALAKVAEVGEAGEIGRPASSPPSPRPLLMTWSAI